MKVLVTGAAGDIGRKVCQYLISRTDHEVIALDLVADRESGILKADLATFDVEWAKLFEGVDAVVHLAANRRKYADWPDLWPDNVDAALNVYEAAARHGPMRFVFASSLGTLDEYHWQDGPILDTQPPNPSSAYGASKVFGERVGKYFAEHRGLSVVCLRIGDVLKGETERADKVAYKDESIWEQQKWLSSNDLGQIVERALIAENISFEIVCAVSDNAGMRWTLKAAEQALGFKPKDSSSPKAPSPFRSLRIGLRRWLYRLSSQYVKSGP